MTAALELEVEVDGNRAKITAAPPYGRRVIFEVVYRRPVPSRSLEPAYVVQLLGHDLGEGFAHHRTLELAVRSAVWRARRYVRAYSKPRGLAT